MAHDLPHLKRVLKNFENSMSNVQQSVRELTISKNELSKVISREMDIDLSQDLGSVQLSNMQAFDNIRNQINQFVQTQETILINSTSEKYASKTRSWFYSNLKSIKNDVLFDLEGLDYAKIRCSNFNHWTMQALEIGCGTGYWYDSLAGFSPVYEADINWNLFPEISSKFEPLFFEQDRMRFVKTNGTDLPGMEDQCVDFVFSWNTFNYLPLGVIKDYLDSIHRVLRPGGYAMITYANANRDDSYKYILEGHWAYNTSEHMTKLVREAGFTPKALFETGIRGSWIEFVKPGPNKFTEDYSIGSNSYCKKVF